MEKPFILNPNVNNIFDLQDAIDERIAKARSIVFALMINSDVGKFSLLGRTINNILWAIDGFLEEIHELQNRIWELHAQKN